MFWHYCISSLKILLQAWATGTSYELLKKEQTWIFSPWDEKTEIFLLTFLNNIWSKHLVTFDHTLTTDPCKTVVKNFSKASTSSVYALLIEPYLIFPFIDKLYFKFL